MGQVLPNPIRPRKTTFSKRIDFMMYGSMSYNIVCIGIFESLTQLVCTATESNRTTQCILHRPGAISIMYFVRYRVFLIAILQAGCHAAHWLNDHGRWAQIRLYNKPGCFQENDGELGLYETEISICRSTSEGYLESLRVEYIEEGCYSTFLSSLFTFQYLIDIPVVHLFSDFNCSSPPEIVYSHACFSDAGRIGSMELLCPSFSSEPNHAVAR